MSDYLTIKEVAEKLGKTRETIRVWIKEGKLKGKKINGGYGILPGDLEELLNPVPEEEESQESKPEKSKEVKKLDVEIELLTIKAARDSLLIAKQNTDSQLETGKTIEEREEELAELAKELEETSLECEKEGEKFQQERGDFKQEKDDFLAAAEALKSAQASLEKAQQELGKRQANFEVKMEEDKQAITNEEARAKQGICAKGEGIEALYQQYTEELDSRGASIKKEKEENEKLWGEGRKQAIALNGARANLLDYLIQGVDYANEHNLPKLANVFERAYHTIPLGVNWFKGGSNDNFS